MLRRKEAADLQARTAAQQKTHKLYEMKGDVQEQMVEREKMREAAFAEYATKDNWQTKSSTK